MDHAEGYLDGLSGEVIYGWAWWPAAPSEPALVELVAGDRVIAATLASLHRQDLVEAGKRNGRCGFEFTLSEETPRNVPIFARVQSEADSYRLGGEPVIIDGVQPSPAPAETASPAVGPAPIDLSSPSGIAGYIDQFGPERIIGWALWEHDLSRPVTVVLREEGRDIIKLHAGAWRPDLYEARQGGGWCGIDAPIPDQLRDGGTHLVDILLAETSESLIARPIEVAFPPRPAHFLSPQPRRPPKSAPLLFSFVVNFYNMRREAERTLTSLTRGYQRDIDDIAYEVLCIDNGAEPSLDPKWIESFGPEFRHFRPSQVFPSPCAAINEAVRSANGQYVGVMIDGAHVLTPGVLREAADAFKEHPDSIFAPRQWWLAGDQRWLSSVGYTPQMEDVLFDRIGWPRDGYELFNVGAPVVESPNSWFDGMGESNCLMLPKSLYENIGGLDEGFDEPGGGLANLDLFTRAAAVVVDKIISPVGEASFHQYHAGTTTNVSDEEKDRRVRSYENRYRDLRGKSFTGVNPERIYLRGRIRSNAMATPCPKPWFTPKFGITDRTRPAKLADHLDANAQIYLQSLYAECGLDQGTSWAGRQVRLAPGDLVNIQMILNCVRPEVVVTTTRDDGLVHFLETMRSAMDLEDLRIVRVLSQDEPLREDASHVHAICGPPYAPSTLAAVSHAIGSAEAVAVLFEPQGDDFMPVEAIKTYARFVSFRSYFVFLGTVLGSPWLGYSRYWFFEAIRAFLRQDPTFVRDQTKDDQLMLMCPYGYLQRVRKRDLFETYDDSLDEFA